MRHRIHSSVYLDFSEAGDVRIKPSEVSSFGLNFQAEEGGNLTLILGDDGTELHLVWLRLAHLGEALNALAQRLPASARRKPDDGPSPYREP